MTCLCLPQTPRVADSVRDAIEKGAGYYEGTYHLPNTQKKTPLRAFFNGVHGMDNRIIGGVAIIEDFTERKRSEEIIYRQAYYDALTDLPNRRLFIERLESLDTHTIDQKRSGLVLFLDMDRFKLINDTLGHAAGGCIAGAGRATLGVLPTRRRYGRTVKWR